jgi:pimeloyl-ACP methyl ester carboxylesterase
MKVTGKALPPAAPIAVSSLVSLTSLCRRLLETTGLLLPSLSPAALRAAVLEAVIFTGHLVLYPSGIVQERVTEAVLPGQRDPADADTLRLPTESRPPVLLLHGFADNRSVFVLLRRTLGRHGGPRIESFNHSPLTCDIRRAAEILSRRVEDLCERTGHARVDVVGHSLGGLIARYYVQRLGGDSRVRTLVTLGTPHSGTRAVPLADAHPIVRQMRPGSDLIEELRAPAPGCRTRFVSFWSDLDQMMVPVETARLDHPDLDAWNVRVTGIGHLALPVHPAVAEGVRQALDATGTVDGAAREAGGVTVA